MLQVLGDFGIRSRNSPTCAAVISESCQDLPNRRGAVAGSCGGELPATPRSRRLRLAKRAGRVHAVRHHLRAHAELDRGDTHRRPRHGDHHRRGARDK
jgi:hypothetical protein